MTGTDPVGDPDRGAPDPADVERRLRAVEGRLAGDDADPDGSDDRHDATATDHAVPDREGDRPDLTREEDRTDATPGENHDAPAVAALADRVTALEDRVEAVEDRLEEQEAAVQALRGYVGSVRAVNREVEDRADAALAAARSLERRLDGTAADGVPAPVTAGDGSGTTASPDGQWVGETGDDAASRTKVYSTDPDDGDDEDRRDGGDEAGAIDGRDEADRIEARDGEDGSDDRDDEDRVETRDEEAVPEGREDGNRIGTRDEENRIGTGDDEDGIDGRDEGGGADGRGTTVAWETVQSRVGSDDEPGSGWAVGGDSTPSTTPGGRSTERTGSEPEDAADAGSAPADFSPEEWPGEGRTRAADPGDDPRPGGTGGTGEEAAGPGDGNGSTGGTTARGASPDPPGRGRSGGSPAALPGDGRSDGGSGGRGGRSGRRAGTAVGGSAGGDDAAPTGRSPDPSRSAGEAPEGWNWPPDGEADVERAAPWSVPDPVPPAEDEEGSDAGDGGILAKLRGVL